MNDIYHIIDPGKRNPRMVRFESDSNFARPV